MIFQSRTWQTTKFKCKNRILKHCGLLKKPGEKQSPFQEVTLLMDHPLFTNCLIFKTKQTKIDYMILSKEESCQDWSLKTLRVECNKQKEMLHSAIWGLRFKFMCSSLFLSICI